MIELFLMIAIYQNDEISVRREYKTLEHCEKAKELANYEKTDFTKLIICKKLVIYTSKNNPFN